MNPELWKRALALAPVHCSEEGRLDIYIGLLAQSGLPYDRTTLRVPIKTTQMTMAELYCSSNCTFTVVVASLGVHSLSRTLDKIKLTGLAPAAGFIDRAIEAYLSQLALSVKPTDQAFREKYPLAEIRQNLHDWLEYECAPNDTVWH